MLLFWKTFNEYILNNNDTCSFEPQIKTTRWDSVLQAAAAHDHEIIIIIYSFVQGCACRCPLLLDK